MPIKIADYDALLSPQRLRAIRALPYLQQIGADRLDLAGTLAFYSKRYVRQLPDFIDPQPDTVIADVGGGVGWLALVLALETPSRIIAVEPDPDCVATARQLADILGLAERIEFRPGALGGPLPLADREVDLVYAVEVLEHVQRNPAAVSDLCRVSKRWIVATTPNLWFPAVAHDTRLPFAHWLPIPWRRAYARLAGKNPDIDHNLFWSPPGLARHMHGYRRRSRFLHYADYARFAQTFPFYMPYDHGYWVQAPGRIKRLYYGLLRRFGRYNAALLPNLAGTFERQG